MSTPRSPRKANPAKQTRPRLLTHREVAKLVSIDTQTLREWVAVGEWPEPLAIVSKTWFFKAAQIDHFLETGTWPEGTRFKRGLGRGRYQPGGPDPAGQGEG